MSRSEWQDLPQRLASVWTPTQEDLRFQDDESVSMYGPWHDTRTFVARLSWAAAMSQEKRPFNDAVLAVRYLTHVMFPYPALERITRTICRLMTLRRYSSDNSVIPMLLGPPNTGKSTTALLAAALSDDTDFAGTHRVYAEADHGMPATMNTPIPMIVLRGRQARNRDLMVSGLNFCTHVVVRSESAGDLQTRLLSQATRSGTRLILLDNEHGTHTGEEKSTFFRDLIQASPALVVITRVEDLNQGNKRRQNAVSKDPNEEQIAERRHNLWFEPLNGDDVRDAVFANALQMCRVQLPSRKESAQIVHAVDVASQGFPCRIFRNLKMASTHAYLENSGKLTLDIVEEAIHKGAAPADLASVS